MRGPDALTRGMRQRHTTRRATVGGAILALALLLAACGQTSGAATPDTLAITVATLGSAAQTQTYTIRASAKVQAIYQHMLALPIIPRGASPACRATRHSEQFDFSGGGTTILTATIGECANILQLPHNVNRAPDTPFWNLIDSATGQRLEPM